MIKANELRIGNLVCDELGLVIIGDNGKIEFADVYEAIPLTEEWLLRWGFVQVEKLFTIKTGWYFDVRKEKKQTKLNIKHTSAGNFLVVSPANGSIYLKSIHQLQNLYFALTSEELTKH